MRKILCSIACSLQVFLFLSFFVMAGSGFSQESQENTAENKIQAETSDSAVIQQPSPEKSSLSRTITLDFKDADIQSVLRIISFKSGVNIVTTPEVIGNVTIRLVDVPWEQALDTITKTCGFGYERLSDKIIMVSTLEKLAQQRKSQQEAAEMEPLDTQSFVLNFSRADDVKTSVEKLITPKGKIALETRTNTLLITDTKSNLKLVGDIVKSLDKATRQVMIEAKIIETTLGTAEKLGVNWTTQITATGAKRPITFPFDATNTNAMKSILPYSKPTASGTAGDFPSVGTAPPLTGEPFGFPYAIKSDFMLGTLDFSSFQAILEVLNSRTDTKILSNPRITTLDNQEAKMLVGTIIPIPLYEYSKDTGTQVVSGYQNQEVGIRLVVTPNINEMNYITLSIKPNVDEISGYTGPNNERPIISTRSAETKVMIKDGQTLILGGLISETKLKMRKGIPFLKDIPVIKYLFSKKEDTVDRTELLIFITPHIVKNDAFSGEEAAKLEEQLGNYPPPGENKKASNIKKK